MMATNRSFIKDWVPPAIWRTLRRIAGSPASFRGNYKSWEEARAHSTGYDSAQIVSRVLSATLAVKRGEACFERDSVLFDQPAPRYPVIAERLTCALAQHGRLDVLDFGGALGSLYFQHRSFFSNLEAVQWSVVEQKEFLTQGRAHVADGCLRFYESIEACCKERSPAIGIASSALQYLPNPRELLLQLLAATRATILDRLPLIDAATDRLTVQTVPPSIYSASYPAWFFSRGQFLELLTANGFRPVREFDSIDELELDGRPVRTTGMVIEKIG